MGDWRDEPKPDDSIISKWSFKAIHTMMSGTRAEALAIHAKLDEKFPGVGFGAAKDELEVVWKAK